MVAEAALQTSSKSSSRLLRSQGAGVGPQHAEYTSHVDLESSYSLFTGPPLRKSCIEQVPCHLNISTHRCVTIAMDRGVCLIVHF